MVSVKQFLTVTGQQSALPKCYVYYCCDCLPAVLWKLLVGWLQHKHIWNLCTHDLFEASSIRWEKNEAPRPPLQGPNRDGCQLTGASL